MSGYLDGVIDLDEAVVVDSEEDLKQPGLHHVTLYLPDDSHRHKKERQHSPHRQGEE